MLQGTIVAIENKQKLLYGLQYHPEVQHSERGIATLKRFLFGIARMPADWKIENVLHEEMDKIKATVSLPIPDRFDTSSVCEESGVLVATTSTRCAQAYTLPRSLHLLFIAWSANLGSFQ